MAANSMGERGVTRPDMGHDGHDEHKENQDHHHEMTPQMRREMLQAHHEKTLWIWWAIILVGLWLMAAPLTFDYGQNPATPAGGRSVWLSSVGARVSAMFWNDLVCGALLVGLGWRTLTAGRPRTKWAACFVGIWLQFAPLVFWCPSPLAYLNDTLVGVWVIALTVLIPGMPWMIMMMKMGTQVPPGWSYSPSSWPQRFVMIVLAFAGWIVSRYLGAYQLGYLNQAWDPIFGDGTRRVLESDMSEMWPISDGALGAMSYTLEFLMGFMGSVARWRTMPWMVLFFGVLVVPLGLTHIFLVSSMPVVVGHWCTMCLLAALIMLPMIPLTLDEVVAMCLFMWKAVREQGKPFWRTFWKGDDIQGPGDDPGPALVDFPQHPWRITLAGCWGVSLAPGLVAATLVGAWVMAAPSAMGTAKPAFTGIYLAGVLVVVISVCSLAEVARAARFLNLPVGLWLIAAPFVLDGGGWGATANAVACGMAVILLSLPKGPIRQRYGVWERLVV